VASKSISRRISSIALAIVLGAFGFSPVVYAQDAEQKDATTASPPTELAEEKMQPKKPSGAIQRLSPKAPVWIDTKRKMVIVDGEIVLRRGSLEMFACLTGTKEHESVVAVPSDAFVIHAGLLAAGGKQGKPAEFDPEYAPPSGEVIDVIVQWKDQDGKLHQRRAQDFVRDARSGKPMPYNWVFAGSYMWEDLTIEQQMEDQRRAEQGLPPAKRDGKTRMVYAAEGGELICVSNFRSSMLDVPVPSSQANSDLWFEAYTENIPPEGTKVRLFLIPRGSWKQEESSEKGANASKSQISAPTEDSASQSSEKEKDGDESKPNGEEAANEESLGDNTELPEFPADSAADDKPPAE